MLEPRMVAARIQGLSSALHGTSPIDDWGPVSQGVLMEGYRGHSNGAHLAVSGMGNKGKSLFLFSACFRGIFLLHAWHAGQQFVERIFGGHLFAAALVLAVLVFAAAGAAARDLHLFAHHGNYGMVGRPLPSPTSVAILLAYS